MRISLKVIGMFWVLLFIIIGGLLYNAYSKLKPDTLITLLTEQVKKNYPDAILNVGKVSYRFSLDFNLNLKDIQLVRNGKILGNVGELELKVPWWLLLLNRGNAQINLSNLDIYIDHDKNKIHDDIKFKPNTQKKLDSSLLKISLPKYLADAKFTLRAKSISIRDIHNTRRYFTISKLLVREFQYAKNSAFEVNIPIQIRHNNVQYSSDLWLFGDVTPESTEWKVNYRGEFRTRETNDKFHIEDLVINGVSSFDPSTLALTSNVNLLIDKKQIGNGNFQANQDSFGINLYFSKLPLSYFGVAYEEIKSPYLKKFEGHAAGELKFEKNFDTLSTTLLGRLNFDGELYLNDATRIQGKWKIVFQDSRWEIGFISPKGEASFFRRSVIDFKKNTISQYSEELGFSGLDLNQMISPAISPVKLFNQVDSPYFTTTISYKQCFIGDNIVDGNFKYGIQPDHKFYQAELGNDKSYFKASYSHKAAGHFLDLQFKKFGWNLNYPFLAPFFTASEGLLDGKVEGRWDKTWDSGQWLVMLSMEQLKNASGPLSDFLTKTYSVFSIDESTIQKQVLDFSVKKSILSINSLISEGVLTTKIVGTLNAKNKSTLLLTHPKDKKFKPLKKELLENFWLEKEGI